METVFDSEIQGRRRLHIPARYRNAVFGSEDEFYSSDLTIDKVHMLIMYRKDWFPQFKNRFFPRADIDDTEQTLAYGSAELTKIEDNGRIFLRQISIAHLFGLKDWSGLDSIVGPLKGDAFKDFLVLLTPENFYKYLSHISQL